MQDAFPPRVPKWPFYLSDAILLAAAWYVLWQAASPLGLAELAGSLFCLALGACISVLPFLLEYRAAVRKTEATTLAEGLERIQNAQIIAIRIAEATDNWQAIQEQSGQTVSAAREITDRMAAEVREFTEFLRKANDSEKATLRLEVDKLRRGETEWLQVLVRLFDHVYALHTAGARSGQPKLTAQLTQFQDACRDIARRMGFAPFVASAGEEFDPQRHRTPEEKPIAAGVPVRETVATGYTFQGRLLRPAMVLVGSPEELPAGKSGHSSSPPPEEATEDRPLL